MFSEQIAILLLVAATQIANQAPPPPLPAQLATSTTAAEQRVLKLKIERGFTDVATRQHYRKLVQRKSRTPPHEAPIMVARN